MLPPIPPVPKGPPPVSPEPPAPGPRPPVPVPAPPVPVMLLVSDWLQPPAAAAITLDSKRHERMAREPSEQMSRLRPGIGHRHDLRAERDEIQVPVELRRGAAGGVDGEGAVAARIALERVDGLPRPVGDQPAGGGAERERGLLAGVRQAGP